ncbi:restriction endonuclease subunit S [Halomonas piscis]|uniref:restriction endonuclease subunit S n=1 Tax=Halomonas piscis TaxID=3031727 RepID=UPI0028A22185|nr:restriction endonuclease subunit S [Halomonas piscis]
MSSFVTPKKWLTVPLEDVILRIVGGGTPSKSKPEYYQGEIPWMSVKDMNKHVLQDTVDHISQAAVDNSSTNVIPAEIPIIATRMGLGKIVIADFDSAINQDLKALFLPTEVHRDYFVYWYRSVAQKIERMGTGTTVKGIRLEVLKGLEFALPPLAEQRVIADKLDTLLAQVENTKARLEHISQILKRFRQSVLAAAVSGRLTEGWRSGDNPERNFKNLGEAGVEVKTGPFGSALHKSDYVNGGIPVINPMHISEGTIKPSESMTISHQKYTSLEAWHLRKGDVVVGRRGEMGRASVVESDEPQLCGTGSMILRVGEDALPKYLEIILRSPTAVSYFNSDSVGSTMVNLNQKIIKNFEVYFPSLSEQTEIVRRIDQLFAHADRTEQQVNNALAHVNNLTQSILAKAFRGELTEQWRKDNPALISEENSAEALLERIKAERAAAKPVKKTRKKAPS